MARLHGSVNKNDYHYVIIYQQGGNKYFKTHKDIMDQHTISYKTIKSFMRKENYTSKKFPFIKDIKRIKIPVNAIPIFD
jgi:hypothetical protein